MQSGSTMMPDYTVNNEDTIHLGYVEIINDGGNESITYNPVTVDDSVSGFIPVPTGSTGIEVKDVSPSINEQIIEIEFNETIGFKDLAENEEVQFDIEETEKGLNALNVIKL